MGSEIGSWNEWNHDASLDWHLLERAEHAGLRALVRDLNRLHRVEPALHARDCESTGFEWVDANDAQQSVLTFLRRDGGNAILVACHATPVPRLNHRVGVPVPGFWREILNTDARDYGGSGIGNLGGVEAAPAPMHGRPHLTGFHIMAAKIVPATRRLTR